MSSFMLLFSRFHVVAYLVDSQCVAKGLLLACDLVSFAMRFGLFWLAIWALLESCLTYIGFYVVLFYLSVVPGVYNIRY